RGLSGRDLNRPKRSRVTHMRQRLASNVAVAKAVSALPKHSFKPLRCHLLSVGADMRRREFIAALSGVAAWWPLAVTAQQVRLPVIGILHSQTPESELQRMPSIQ